MVRIGFTQLSDFGHHATIQLRIDRDRLLERFDYAIQDIVSSSQLLSPPAVVAILHAHGTRAFSTPGCAHRSIPASLRNSSLQRASIETPRGDRPAAWSWPTRSPGATRTDR